MKLVRRCWCCKCCSKEEEELEEQQEEVLASVKTAEKDDRMIVIKLSAQAPPSLRRCSSPRAAARPTHRIVQYSN